MLGMHEEISESPVGVQSLQLVTLWMQVFCHVLVGPMVRDEGMDGAHEAWWRRHLRGKLRKSRSKQSNCGENSKSGFHFGKR